MVENPKFPFTRLEDYNIESYLRTDAPCANGDWILYTFTNPVTSSKIDVLTGFRIILDLLSTMGM
ncbi:hypothetical protein [Flavobacterium sp. 140616W15]|uniref:hypothetical protein n=1 Tax=Flavobacterium sp. 140616W15 TaxID=2478552 RepID=UPI000F0C6E11|nr:hypothetical protein [Flavobacterium sp. 140616W15]AYN02745.1 hypothetical protein EAG11_00060 [Flavobacterium sp. 140616W15]